MINNSNTLTAGNLEFSNTLSVVEVQTSVEQLIQVSAMLEYSNAKAHSIVEQVIDTLYQRFQVIC